MASHVRITPSAQALLGDLRSAIVATGWSETARRTGLERTALHRSFHARRGDKGLSLASASAVAEALGLRLALIPVAERNAGESLVAGPSRQAVPEEFLAAGPPYQPVPEEFLAAGPPYQPVPACG